MDANTPAWNIYGNTAAVERLRRAVTQGPRHAYLVTGPHDIGKSLLATTFAAALMCPGRSDGAEPCRNCSTCRRVFRGAHPDVTRFDLAYQATHDEGTSKNLTLNIKTARDIGKYVSLRPVESKWRVVVVDDVETMQETAQEAFLKTLEEPPSYVVILLLCTHADLLLPTILSRCAIVPMIPVTDAIVKDALIDRGADQATAERIAPAARGRVGLAIRALEDEALFDILVEHVSRAVDWVTADEYGRMVEAFRLADQFTGAREKVFDRLSVAQSAWRELVLEAVGAGSGREHPATSTSRIPDVPSGVEALKAIDRCIRDLDANVRPRSALATMVQSWPELVRA